MSALVLPREELNWVLRVLYLTFQAPILVAWSAISGLCHYIALGQFSSLLFNDVLLKILFKQYLGCLYNHKVPLVKLPSLLQWPEWAPACGPSHYNGV